MKQNTNSPTLTLEDIGKLLDNKFDEKLGEFRLEMNDCFREVNEKIDDSFEKTSGRLDGIDDRLRAQSERVRKVERGLLSVKSLVYQKVDSLKIEINDRFEDMEKSHEEILGKIQEFIGVTDKNATTKVKQLRNTIEPRLEKLEHSFKFN